MEEITSAAVTIFYGGNFEFSNISPAQIKAIISYLGLLLKQEVDNIEINNHLIGIEEAKNILEEFNLSEEIIQELLDLANILFIIFLIKKAILANNSINKPKI